jgi:CRISPR-associated protein Cmr1
MMPRSLVNVNPPQKLELKTDRETWTLELRTITPMFGGSATTREVDPQNPIRPSSVRGHLRFWWRAIAGAKFSSAQELFEAEAKIWGKAAEKNDKAGSSGPGLVSLRIEILSSGNRQRCAIYPTGKSFPDFGQYPGYALFPFQGKANRDGVQEQPSEMLTDIRFKVVLSYPAERASEIQMAVNAWVMFGGIGARTRRGCGSLEAVTPSIKLSPVKRQNANLLTLASDRYFVGKLQKDPVRAWKEAVEMYRDFHQKEHFARNEGSERNRPGRSRYPEADTIRRLSNTHAPKHAPKHVVQGFPRADLGLPIVFHFKDDREGDPQDHTLQGKQTNQTRFASPAITKAIAVPGGYYAVLVILDAPHVWKNGDLVLKSKNGLDQTITESQINLKPTEYAKILPLEGRPIREALIAFALSRGFTEVKL